MGHSVHEAVLVTSWREESVIRARRAAVAAYAEQGLSHLVGSIIERTINVGAIFLIAPSGSQIGYECRTKEVAARERFLREIDSKQFKSQYPYLVWAVVHIDGDELEKPVISAFGGYNVLAEVT